MRGHDRVTGIFRFAIGGHRVDMIAQSTPREVRPDAVQGSARAVPRTSPAKRRGSGGASPEGASSGRPVALRAKQATNVDFGSAHAGGSGSDGMSPSPPASALPDSNPEVQVQEWVVRLAQGCSIRRIAQATGFNRETVRRYLHGKSTVPATFLVALSRSRGWSLGPVTNQQFDTQTPE